MSRVDFLRKINSIKTERAITLIALVITIIVLLILAGVTVVTLTGENGLLSKAQLAKERNVESERDEKDKLTSYEDEIDNYNTWERTGGTETTKRYSVTPLYIGSAGSNSTITFADDHTLNEFDKIKFLFGEKSNNKWQAMDTREYTIEELEFIIDNHSDCTYWIGLYTYSNYYIDIYDVTQTGLKIKNVNGRELAAIYGIKY